LQQRTNSRRPHERHGNAGFFLLGFERIRRKPAIDHNRTLGSLLSRYRSRRASRLILLDASPHAHPPTAMRVLALQVTQEYVDEYVLGIGARAAPVHGRPAIAALFVSPGGRGGASARGHGVVAAANSADRKRAAATTLPFADAAAAEGVAA
jgi:hypothetical protein